jgi:hypothetical protein
MPLSAVTESVAGDDIAAVAAENGWEVIETPPQVSLAETQSITRTAYLHQLLGEKFAEWDADLRSAKNPEQEAQYFLNMCNAVKAMGY